MARQMLIRGALQADLPILAEYWYDRMVMVQQYNPQVRLLPQAQQRWQAAAEGWLNDPNTIFQVAETPGQDLLGGVAGQIVDNDAGLAPAKIGQVVAFVIDLHTPRLQAGVGRILIDTLRQQLAQRHIQRIMITVFPALSVEAAFWQAIGARQYSGNYWLRSDTEHTK